MVFKEYTKEPVVQLEGDVLTVTAGEDCGEIIPETEDESSARAITSIVGTAAALLSGAGWPVATAFALASQLGMAQAQSTSECQLTPIEVMVYVGAEANEIVMRESQSGDFEVCPPESLYWKHHPVGSFLFLFANRLTG